MKKFLYIFSIVFTIVIFCSCNNQVKTGEADIIQNDTSEQNISEVETTVF